MEKKVCTDTVRPKSSNEPIKIIVTYETKRTKINDCKKESRDGKTTTTTTTGSERDDDDDDENDDAGTSGKEKNDTYRSTIGDVYEDDFEGSDDVVADENVGYLTTRV